MTFPALSLEAGAVQQLVLAALVVELRDQAAVPKLLGGRGARERAQ